MFSDDYWMARAMALAESALGRTSPNPAVGCVAVRDGEVVGEGYHPGAGHPHAEVFALEAAGPRARGATVFVTLEPCSTFGRTPACTEALIEAGVAEVVYGTRDPNPAHRGAGIAALERAGVTVRTAGDEAALRAMNRGFFSAMERGRPYVSAKIAICRDGAVTLAPGTRTRISGPAAGAWVHRWRCAGDAVLVGVGTALIDDPLLTARPPEGCPRQPVRVVLDSDGRLPLDSQLTKTAARLPLSVITSSRSDVSWREALAAAGATVEVVPIDGGGLDLAATLRLVMSGGALEITAEPGPTLLGGLVSTGLLDELNLIVSPQTAQPGAPCWSDRLPDDVSWSDRAEEAGARLPSAWPILRTERLGDDVLITLGVGARTPWSTEHAGG